MCAAPHSLPAAPRSAWEAERSRLAAAEREAVRRLADQQRELRVREERLTQIRCVRQQLQHPVLWTIEVASCCSKPACHQRVIIAVCWRMYNVMGELGSSYCTGLHVLWASRWLVR
jgi:hypothetical protein